MFFYKAETLPEITWNIWNIYMLTQQNKKNAQKFQKRQNMLLNFLQGLANSTKTVSLFIQLKKNIKTI